MAARPHAQPPARPRERGQATVETVGIIVAIAILLAATGALLSGGMALPRPPDLIGAIARVFGRDEPVGRRPGLDVPGAGGYVRADHGFISPETDPPIGRRLGDLGEMGLLAAGRVRDGGAAVVRFAGAYVELPAACGRAFTAAFLERARERALALANPRELLRALREIARDPEAALRLVPNPVDLVRHVRSYWSMSWRERALQASRDAGRTAADIAIDQLTRGAGRLVRRLPRGPGSSRAPGPPRGGEPRGLRVGDAAAMR